MFYCSIGGAIGRSADNKKKREKLEREMRELKANALNRLEAILKNQYAQAENFSKFSYGDYTEAEKLINDNRKYIWYDELTTLYNNYIDMHVTAIDSYIQKGSEVFLRLMINHFYHYCKMNSRGNIQVPEALKEITDFYDKKPYFLDAEKYGQINTEFYNEIINLNASRNDVEKLHRIYNKITHDKQIVNFNLDFVKTSLKTLYSVAFQEPFDAQMYSLVYEIYDKYTYSAYDNGYKVYAIPTFDLMFTKIYSYFRMGKGVLDQISGQIDNWINATRNGNSSDIILMASGMMWMGNYDLEHRLLKIAASNNIPMEPYVQERLKFLESGGAVGPSMFNVSDNSNFNYDYSAINWQAKDFDTFFRNIIFKNENINYALAIPEFKKSFKSKHQTVITYEKIYDQLLKMAQNEYMSEISCQKVVANSLSETDSFEENAILVIPDKTEIKAEYAGELVFYDRIGVNVNIRIVTVFIPNVDIPAKDNMNRALGLKQGNYPKLNIVLESIKDSIAREIDDLCESGPVSTDIY